MKSVMNSKINYVISIIALLSLILLSGCSATPYAKVGVGYKIDELELYYDDGSSGNEPLSARIEAGFESENISYGVSHHSQWFSGFPFDDKVEYYKTELFVDYKFELK